MEIRDKDTMLGMALDRLEAMVKRGCEDRDHVTGDPLCYFCGSDTLAEGPDGKRHFLHEDDCAYAMACDFLDEVASL
jgi:hypothetical protein